MGVFSWDCNGCGHPMLMPCNTNEVNAWMAEVVVIEKKHGMPVKGTYDGYGCVSGIDIHSGNDPCCWHVACWDAAGCPVEYKPSTYSNDQGHFFDEGDHDMERPKS